MVPLLLLLVLADQACSYSRSPSMMKRSMGSMVVRSSSSSSSTVVEKVSAPVILSKPKWAAGGIVSDTVNALISFKPLFGIMKGMARNTLIETAEKNAIPWRGRAEELEGENEVLSGLLESVEDKSVSYPAYYTQEFHAYDEGNLNWQAAYECESATMSMALRVYPKEGLTAREAQDKMRKGFLDAVKDFIADYNPSTSSSSPSSISSFKWPWDSSSSSSSSSSSAISNIIDIGCSVGVSTNYIARSFPEASVDGLDLSAYFLAVAQYNQSKIQKDMGITEEEKKVLGKINWLHADIGKNNGIQSATYNLATACFVFHELPAEPTTNIIMEIHRILKSKGVVAIIDNDPQSPVIQNLPPALFTLMKSTEPWSDQYYVFDLEESLRAAGFINVRTVASDPRHRTVMAQKP